MSDQPTEQPLPYGRQWVDDDDVAAVAEVVGSDWLTTGPAVEAFEEALAQFVGARYGVAVSSGTAALHAAMHAVGVGPGDEVIVPAMTFVGTANAIVFEGGRPVFADVTADDLLVDPASVEHRITARTKGIVAVDYAGQPCDYGSLEEIAARHGLPVIADGCHALGAELNGDPVGTLVALTAFSFHPVKHITTAEGGMVVTDDEEMAGRMRRFRNHGISRDFRERATEGSWEYEMVELGYNYRLSDVHCALGLSQLKKLPGWLERRRELARRYDEALAGVDGVEPLRTRPGVEHAYHLYVVRLDDPGRRQAVYEHMRGRGIGVNVHYLPVHLHEFHTRTFGTGPGLCPVAENAYERILSLPMFPAMADTAVDRVAEALEEALG